MKTTILSLLLSCVLVFSTPAFSSSYSEQEYDASFVPVDLLVFRPLGLVATLVGVGAFIVLVPFSALAQISPPHDAFHRTANLFIYAPGKYTFDRPLGIKGPIKFQKP